MTKIARLSAAALALGLAACVPDAEGAPRTAEKGVAQGRVTDGSGRPIAGAEIVINNTVWHNHNIVLLSDEHGEFRVDMPATDSWYVRGSIKRVYHDRTYTLPLDPSPDGAFTGQAGVVCDLTLKVAGPVPTSFGWAGHFGGTVIVNDYDGGDLDLGEIELSLEPTDALIDGSAGKPITRKLIRGAEGHVVEDVPIGSYRISARDLPTGKPLRLRHRHATGETEAVTLDFEPIYPGATSYAIPLAVSR